MGYARICQIGIVFVAIITAGVLADPAKPAERKSADGVPLPEVVSPNPPIKIKLPIIGERLGCRPEEFGVRLSRTPSKQTNMIAKDKISGSAPWYCGPVAGADWAEVWLTDGRVARIQLHYAGMHHLPTDDLAKQLKPMSPTMVGPQELVLPLPGKSDPAIRMRTGSNYLDVEIIPAFLYVQTHSVASDIEKALLANKVVKGMKLDEVKLLFGEPVLTEEGTDGHGARWVVERYNQLDGSSGQWIKVPFDPNVMDLVGNKYQLVKAKDRQIDCIFKNNVVTEFTDAKLKN